MRRYDTTEILSIVRSYTMVADSGVRFAAHQTTELVERNIPGVIVECGVWRGGCALAMLLAQRRAFGEVVRPVHLLDSFRGLPPATRRDGPGALEWQASTVDNCAATRKEVVDLMGWFSFNEGVDYHVHEGWFAETLPNFREQVALLRLDGDWYRSTRECLDALVPRVSEHGTVILDDYYAWDGCARAVHEYLAVNDLPYRIRSLPGYTSAYFKKEGESK